MKLAIGIAVLSGGTPYAVYLFTLNCWFADGLRPDTM